MLGLTIAAIVTVAAGYLIVKRAYAPAVLLVAGVVLLAIILIFTALYFKVLSKRVHYK